MRVTERVTRQRCEVVIPRHKAARHGRVNGMTYNLIISTEPRIARFRTADEAVDHLQVFCKTNGLVTVNKGEDNDILDWAIVDPITTATIARAYVTKKA